MAIDMDTSTVTTLYTWGYGNHGLSALEDLVQRLDATVVDIRFSPRSRREDWNQLTLHARFRHHYRWISALGNRNYHQPGAVEIVDLEAGLDLLAPLLQDGSVILLCGCGDPTHCHRSVVAEAARQRFGVAVQHLGVDHPAGAPAEQIGLF